MKLGKPSRPRTLTASGLPVHWLRPSFRFHIQTTFQQLAPYAGAKLVYISLNRSTPCPPRSDVPVNRPLANRRRCWIAFEHELGQICEHPNDVGENHIARTARASSRNLVFPIFLINNSQFPKPCKKTFQTLEAPLFLRLLRASVSPIISSFLYATCCLFYSARRVT
jgi:hypothetical protein